jgi:hypothetical protein
MMLRQQMFDKALMWWNLTIIFCWNISMRAGSLLRDKGLSIPRANDTWKRIQEETRNVMKN